MLTFRSAPADIGSGSGSAFCMAMVWDCVLAGGGGAVAVSELVCRDWEGWNGWLLTAGAYLGAA